MRSEYTIQDERGSCHALQIQDEQLMLDLHPVNAVRQTEQQVTFITDEHEYACTPAACWYAFAGEAAVPTAAEAGRLLADHLARWTYELRLRALLCSLSSLAEELIPRGILPHPRLDPFVEAALARAPQMSTLEKVRALALFLDQPVEQVIAWLQQRGKTVFSPHTDESAVVPQEGEQVLDMPGAAYEAEKGQAARTMFRWTKDMTELLTSEFLAMSRDLNVRAAARAIADRHGWPADKTEYKLYNLQLVERRETQARGDERQQADEGAANGSDVQQELASSAELARRQQNEQQAEETPVPGPVELRRGNYVWDVRIDEGIQRWYLDYPYGAFPVSAGEVIYGGKLYAIQRVGASTATATILHQAHGVEVPVPVQVGAGSCGT